MDGNLRVGCLWIIPANANEQWLCRDLYRAIGCADGRNRNFDGGLGYRHEQVCQQNDHDYNASNDANIGEHLAVESFGHEFWIDDAIPIF